MRRNIILLHLVLLWIFYHIFEIKLKVCKDNCGDYTIENDFCKLVNHIHRLECSKKLTNMIPGTFRGIIGILRPNYKESTFSLTSKFAFLTSIKTTVSLVTSSQNLQNTSHQLHFFSKRFTYSAASEEQRLKIMGVRVHVL